MAKNKFSKVIVSIVILLNALFTLGVLYVFARVGSEPVALIGAWFGFTTGELWLLASIKKNKKREVDINNDISNIKLD